MLLDQLADPACPASPQLAGRADRLARQLDQLVRGLAKEQQVNTIEYWT